jgi:hypothetical protein
MLLTPLSPLGIDPMSVMPTLPMGEPLVVLLGEALVLDVGVAVGVGSGAAVQAAPTRSSPAAMGAMRNNGFMVDTSKECFCRLH